MCVWFLGGGGFLVRVILLNSFIVYRSLNFSRSRGIYMYCTAFCYCMYMFSYMFHCITPISCSSLLKLVITATIDSVLNLNRGSF